MSTQLVFGSLAALDQLVKDLKHDAARSAVELNRLKGDDPATNEYRERIKRAHSRQRLWESVALARRHGCLLNSTGTGFTGKGQS